MHIHTHTHTHTHKDEVNEAYWSSALVKLETRFHWYTQQEAKRIDGV